MKKVPYRTAIAMQPGVLDSHRVELADAAGLLRARLADQPERAVVGVVGIGASYYAALTALRELWKLGVRAVAVDAGQLWQDDLDVADIYVVISASGESLETVEAVRRLRARGRALIVSVTGETVGTLTELADIAVACGQLEDSVPATTSYTGSLQALAFLASAWQDASATAALQRQWAPVPAVLERLLARIDGEAAEAGHLLAGAGEIDFVGAPDANGSAAEGALLYREAPRQATSWFDSRAYLHGPMESLDAGRGIVVIGDDYDDAVARILVQAAAIGCPTVHVTTSAPQPALAGTVLTIPDEPGRLVRAVYEMAVLQLLCAHSAEALELTSGKFRYPQPQVKLKQAS